MKYKLEKFLSEIKENYSRNLQNLMKIQIKQGVICADCHISISDVKGRVRNCAICKCARCLVCDECIIEHWCQNIKFE